LNCSEIAKVITTFVVSVGLVLTAACSDPHQELMEQLINRSPAKRAAAVRSLPSEGGEDAYMLVTKALTDHSTIVRIAAVYALADIKDRDTSAAMIRATRDADPEVRQTAVAKLVVRNKDKAKTVLMDMLLSGEPNSQVRQNIYTELSRLDLSGEGLAEQMAISRVEKINEVWDKSMPAQRVRLVLEAGRIYHSDGLGIVLRGLVDSDAAVALAAMSAVDGRGGKQALRLLIKLASDQSEKIRMVAIGSLSKYGSDGLVVLKGALRDVDPVVRTTALREISKLSAKLDPALACSLLEVKEEKTLLEVIGLLKTQAIDCPLTTFASWLENPELKLYQTCKHAAYAGCCSGKIRRYQRSTRKISQGRTKEDLGRFRQLERGLGNQPIAADRGTCSRKKGHDQAERRAAQKTIRKARLAAG